MYIRKVVFVTLEMAIGLQSHTATLRNDKFVKLMGSHSSFSSLYLRVYGVFFFIVTYKFLLIRKGFP